MRVLVTGVSGQLGHDVARVLAQRGIEYRGTSSKELDITDRAAVEHLMQSYRPDAVIHCAAYTKVDLAEDEPEDTEPEAASEEQTSETSTDKD